MNTCVRRVVYKWFPLSNPRAQEGGIQKFGWNKQQETGRHAIKSPVAEKSQDSTQVPGREVGVSRNRASVGCHYLPNASPIRHHLFHACFVASRITVIEFVILLATFEESVR